MSVELLRLSVLVWRTKGYIVICRLRLDVESRADD